MRTISSGNPVPPSIARNILALLSPWKKVQYRSTLDVSLCTCVCTRAQIAKIREILRGSHRRYNNRDISGCEAVSLRYDDDVDDDDMGPPVRGGIKRDGDCWMWPSKWVPPPVSVQQWRNINLNPNRHPSCPPFAHSPPLSSSFVYSANLRRTDDDASLSWWPVCAALYSRISLAAFSSLAFFALPISLCRPRLSSLCLPL